MEDLSETVRKQWTSKRRLTNNSMLLTTNVVGQFPGIEIYKNRSLLNWIAGWGSLHANIFNLTDQHRSQWKKRFQSQSLQTNKITHRKNG